MAVFELDLYPDMFPDEILWTLTAPNGDNVASGLGTELRRTDGDGSGGEQYMAFRGIPLVTEGQYTFTIFDRSNDGICCLYGYGKYEIRIDGDVIESRDGIYTGQDSVSFIIGRGPARNREEAAPDAARQETFGGLNVRLDLHSGAEDIHWALISPDGIIAAGGHMGGETDVELRTCGVYEFIIRDSAGNGVGSRDSYELRLNGSIVAGGNDFLFEKRESIIVPCGDVLSGEDVTATVDEVQSPAAAEQEGRCKAAGEGCRLYQRDCCAPLRCKRSTGWGASSRCQ